MTDVVILLCTCSEIDEARRIGTALVKSHLAACVNLLPAVESIYRWQGAVETATEVLLLIKSTQDRVSELRSRITELHSYETPEIVAVPISAGSEKYLNWVRGETAIG